MAIAFFLDLVYNGAPSRLDQIPTGFYSVASDDFGQVTGYEFEVDEDGALAFGDYRIEESGWSTETTFNLNLSATAQPFTTIDDSMVFELSDLEDAYGYSPIDPEDEMYLIVPNGCGSGNPTGLWGLVYVPGGAISECTVSWAMLDADVATAVKDIVGTAYVYSGSLDPNLISFEENTWNDYIDSTIANGDTTAYQLYKPNTMTAGAYQLLDASDEPVAVLEVAGDFVCDPPSE